MSTYLNEIAPFKCYQHQQNKDGDNASYEWFFILTYDYTSISIKIKETHIIIDG